MISILSAPVPWRCPSFRHPKMSCLKTPKKHTHLFTRVGGKSCAYTTNANIYISSSKTLILAFPTPTPVANGIFVPPSSSRLPPPSLYDDGSHQWCHRPARLRGTPGIFSIKRKFIVPVPFPTSPELVRHRQRHGTPLVADTDCWSFALRAGLLRQIRRSRIHYRQRTSRRLPVIKGKQPADIP